VAKGQKSKGGAVAAQVFLRSASGRSLDEIAEAPLPDDLSPFRPPPAARADVERFLSRAGFKVFSDEQGITLSIEGPAETFAKVFRTEAARITRVSAADTISLKPPEEIHAIVDSIIVLPKPELH
jgi:hypothetical protein